MELVKVKFSPKAVVQFSEQEVNALFAASDSHYDWKCKEASHCGGLLWGFRNSLVDGKVETLLTFREVDLLAKISEQLLMTHRNQPDLICPMLYGPGSFSGIMNRLNEEYDRVNSQPPQTD